MKCKKLTVQNFYPNNDPLIILGIIINDNIHTFTFKTGNGREYVISRSYKHTLVDTDIDFIVNNS